MPSILKVLWYIGCIRFVVNPCVLSGAMVNVGVELPPNIAIRVREILELSGPNGTPPVKDPETLNTPVILDRLVMLSGAL
jgi:hypothetical protein